MADRANFLIHGHKSFTDSPKFNHLLEALADKSKANKKVTREEIDWLVEQLASIDSIAVN